RTTSPTRCSPRSRASGCSRTARTAEPVDAVVAYLRKQLGTRRSSADGDGSELRFRAAPGPRVQEFPAAARSVGPRAKERTSAGLTPFRGVLRVSRRWEWSRSSMEGCFRPHVREARQGIWPKELGRPHRAGGFGVPDEEHELAASQVLL